MKKRNRVVALVVILGVSILGAAWPYGRGIVSSNPKTKLIVCADSAYLILQDLPHDHFFSDDEFVWRETSPCEVEVDRRFRVFRAVNPFFENRRNELMVVRPADSRPSVLLRHRSGREIRIDPQVLECR